MGLKLLYYLTLLGLAVAGGLWTSSLLHPVLFYKAACFVISDTFSTRTHATMGAWPGVGLFQKKPKQAVNTWETAVGCWVVRSGGA